jgi:hypothetical protein
LFPQPEKSPKKSKNKAAHKKEKLLPLPSGSTFFITMNFQKTPSFIVNPNLINCQNMLSLDEMYRFNALSA